MKKYESIFIVDENKLNTTAEAAVIEIADFIVKHGGNVLEKNEMGRKTLSHPIRKKNSGSFWNIIFELPETEISEMRSHYRLVEAILRLEIFIYERPEKIVTLDVKRL